MQTTLLHFIHPNGQSYFPVQVPAHYTTADILRFLVSQGFLKPGPYRLMAREVTLHPDQVIGQCGLHHEESLQVKYAHRQPQFEGGGKDSILRDTISRDNAEMQQQPAPKPEKKGLLQWLFS